MPKIQLMQIVRSISKELDDGGPLLIMQLLLVSNSGQYMAIAARTWVAAVHTYKNHE